MTIGGSGPSASIGSVDLDGARRQIDLCLDAGVNLIDTADVYSAGVSEELVGQALVGRRDRVLLATKARMPMGEGPNDAGLSRHHLIEACEASLRRLRTDHIDLYQVHEWDGQTPLEETLDTLDTLVRVGQGALHRLLELRRLAAPQGAGDLRPPAPGALRQPADLLLAAGARGRVRAGAGLARPGAGDPRLEPAGGRPALGQVPPRRPAGGGPPPHRLGRAAGARPRTSSTTSSTRWWRSARPTASRPPRSRWPTRSAGRA